MMISESSKLEEEVLTDSLDQHSLSSGNKGKKKGLTPEGGGGGTAPNIGSEGGGAGAAPPPGIGRGRAGPPMTIVPGGA